MIKKPPLTDKQLAEEFSKLGRRLEAVGARMGRSAGAMHHAIEQVRAEVGAVKAEATTLLAAANAAARRDKPKVARPRTLKPRSFTQQPPLEPGVAADFKDRIMRGF